MSSDNDDYNDDDDGDDTEHGDGERGIPTEADGRYGVGVELQYINKVSDDEDNYNL